MCRFVAYLGKKPITLARIIDYPTHSLISQSSNARMGKHGLNADGFGIAWYNQHIDPTAGIFKSVQPAWNDQNLRHISAKIESNCFIGHIRASTVGNVDTLNCHPFSFDDLSFAHNGTIKNFTAIKRKLLRILNDRSYFSIHGETDSEHFFALYHHILHEQFKDHGLKEMASTLIKTIETINELQMNIGKNDYSLLNTVITDGTQLVATRYCSSPKEKQNTLFYSLGDEIMHHTGQGLMHAINTDKPGAILVASEPINELENEWIEVKENHMLLVDRAFNITIQPI